MAEAESARPDGEAAAGPTEPPAEPRLARTVKELADGRYLLLYNQRAEPPDDD